MNVRFEGPRPAIPERTSLLAQIRRFGVGHGVGNSARRELEQLFSSTHGRVGRTPSPPIFRALKSDGLRLLQTRCKPSALGRKLTRRYTHECPLSANSGRQTGSS
jgi:hypothetical protein